MTAGVERLKVPDTAVVLVEPTKAVQATISLHVIFSELKGTIRICDPYLDEATLHHLDACRTDGEIRFLSHRIHESGQVKTLASAFGTSGRKLLIRRTKKASLHDRYVIDRNGMTILGGSLNGFGKKQSFVIRVGRDVRDAMERVFDEEWEKANLWP